MGATEMVLSELARRPAARQFTVFVLLGAVTTGAYLVAYNMLRAVLAPVVANSVAMLGSVILSYFANRRWTFRQEGGGTTRQALIFTVVFVVTLVLSNAALTALFRLVERPRRVHENLVLLAANGLLTLLRFWLVRRWVFTDTPTGADEPTGA